MVGRKFQFVEYGQSFDSSSNDNNRPTISCDGRIPGGVTLELTHWTDNKTPDDLYADTSTEMALKLAADNSKKYDHLHHALVLNNHYDTDGVLSVWACLHGEQALRYSDLVRQGAEAGDFGEWNSDAGVQLDCALTAICEASDDEATAYDQALQKLPDLLRDLTTNGGKSYQSMYEAGGWAEAVEDWQALQDGRASLERVTDDLVVLWEAPQKRLSPYALHRGLQERQWHPHRILRVSKTNNQFSLQYEKAGHGWVQKLVTRRTVPGVDTARLVEHLNAVDGCWKAGGASGLVAICQTSGSISRSVEQVTESILKSDDGFNQQQQQ